MLHIDDLAMFVTIADHSNITAAAQQLQIPKATLSRRLAEYEKLLGKTLFVRSTRVMQLTEDGAQLYQLAKPIVDDALHLVTSLQLPEDKLSGAVTISATNAIGEYLLWPVLQSITKQFPNIQIELKLTESRVNLIQEGIDIAIRMGPLQDSEMLARSITKVRRILVATPQFLAAHKPIERIEQLSSLPALSQGKTLQTLTFKNGERITLQWSLATSNLKLIKTSVLNHKGFALLPDFMIEEELDKAELLALLPNYPLPSAQASIVTPKRAYRSPAIQAVLETIYKHFTDNH